MAKTGFIYIVLAIPRLVPWCAFFATVW